VRGPTTTSTTIGPGQGTVASAHWNTFTPISDWHLAHTLAAHGPVTLAVPGAPQLTSSTVQLMGYDRHTGPGLDPLLAACYVLPVAGGRPLGREDRDRHVPGGQRLAYPLRAFQPEAPTHASPCRRAGELARRPHRVVARARDHVHVGRHAAWAVTPCRPGPRGRWPPGSRRCVGRVVAQVPGGDRKSKALPLDLLGTEFRIRVWKALLTIPRVETSSYREIATAIGRPTSVRAVASAIGNNRLAIVVPCHRVIRHDGSLGGYRWGLPLKRRLIAAEQSGRT